MRRRLNLSSHEHEHEPVDDHHNLTPHDYEPSSGHSLVSLWTSRIASHVESERPCKSPVADVAQAAESHQDAAATARTTATSSSSDSLSSSSSLTAPPSSKPLPLYTRDNTAAAAAADRLFTHSVTVQLPPPKMAMKMKITRMILSLNAPPPRLARFMWRAIRFRPAIYRDHDLLADDVSSVSTPRVSPSTKSGNLSASNNNNNNNNLNTATTTAVVVFSSAHGRIYQASRERAHASFTARVSAYPPVSPSAAAQPPRMMSSMRTTAPPPLSTRRQSS